MSAAEYDALLCESRLSDQTVVDIGREQMASVRGNVHCLTP